MSDFTSNLRPHPDADGKSILQRERDGSNIDVNELSEHLFGTSYLERQRRVLTILEKEKIFSKTNQANLSRPDRYKLGLARGKRMRQLMDIHNWDEDELLMAEYLIDDNHPYRLHIALFAAAMREQCSEEQWKYWMPKIAAWEIIGAYAQTELGHGSNVRGIELTATWDHQTKEFVLHSPTLTASKWWNGTLGRTATHAVVVAQLVILSRTGGKPTQCGPRPFIVQVRDSKTHQPPKSIVVGDIGPKYGYAPMDNAYMLFNQHRVPHSALLCRYASVDPETGTYTRPMNPSSVYGQLTRVCDKPEELFLVISDLFIGSSHHRDEFALGSRQSRNNCRSVPVDSKTVPRPGLDQQLGSRDTSLRLHDRPNPYLATASHSLRPALHRKGNMGVVRAYKDCPHARQRQRRTCRVT